MSLLPTRYRPVLITPGAARLFASALVGRLPQGMSSLAILLLVRDTTHSYAAAGAAVGANALASAASAPLAGRLIDQLGRTRVLAPLACAQATLYVGLVAAARAGTGAAVQILLAGAAGMLLPPIGPVVRVLLGEVFDKPMLRESAYALEAILQELVWIVGPLVVSVLIAVVSPSAAVLALGVFGVCGTVAFLGAQLTRRTRTQAAPRERRPALADTELRSLLVTVALTGAGLGATEVGLPSLALHVGTRSAAGVLLALWSVGSMSGGLWYGSRAWHRPLRSRYRLLLVAVAACTAPLIAARSVAAGAVCSLLAGVAVAPMFSCQYALVGHLAAHGSETEAFAWVAAALIGGVAAGSVAGGALIGPAGMSAPFVLACVVMAMAAAVAAISGGLRTSAASLRRC